GAGRLFGLGRGDWLVGARSDPGLRSIAMAALLKAGHEFAETAAQEPAGTGTAYGLAQLAEETADATLPGTTWRTFSDAAKHFGDLGRRNREDHFDLVTSEE